MKTPWGKSDSTEKIVRGVSWVSTPSHGGLAVSIHSASFLLSKAACDHASDPKKSYLFFEEDCNYAIAFYEHPEWKRALDQHSHDYWKGEKNAPCPLSTINIDKEIDKLAVQVAKSDEEIKGDMLAIVTRWEPEYLEQYLKTVGTAVPLTSVPA
jgi:hypothetical protein